MEKRFLTPKEIANTMINVGVGKANLKTSPMIYLGILAGMYIAFGGLANTIISQTLGNIDPGLAKFAGAAVFPVGLMLVVIGGAELFTGNNLMTLAVMNKKITVSQMSRNWSIVWVANLVGSLILALIVFYGGVLGGDAGTKAIAIAEGKASLDVATLILRGILCNILVVLGVWLAAAAQDIVSKIFACWFPVMLFVLCGFEHSVANMFFIPMGMLLGAKVTMAALVKNLVFVTIGNIIGGGIIIPFLYNYAYLKEEPKVSKQES
ncbi:MULTISPECIES: formate/nitrite transporter family protein [Terrisporobacter]|uniref:Formate/nitrite transporter family protein n=2 Tax=Terrisporobacter TaxID=1505652 RepID=A0AAX2ZJ36_9FIRM|nr:formate/nitrite transporter family protein [Terrisporobacter hibernicus]MBN9647892.1 formate/nitrite transporter family protein [Terrisporobacter glycolicus]UEL49358.1 formate/nitrite transporter family protein [Terrisporobacter hibernicus]